MAILDGRHALVTGGGRGIGRAIAASLSGAGAAVTVLGRQEGPLKDAVAAGDAKGYVVADVTDEGAVGAAVKAGRRGARPGRHPDRQCRQRGKRAVHEGHVRAIPRHVRPQRDGRGACDARGARRHDEARLRPHRGEFLRRGAQGLRLRDRLLRGEARGRRLRARARAGDREERRHRERRVPGLHRHRSGAVAASRMSSRRPAARASRRSPTCSRTSRSAG